MHFACRLGFQKVSCSHERVVLCCRMSKITLYILIIDFANLFMAFISYNIMQGKQEGFIVRKAEKQVQFPHPRSRSQDQTLTNHSTITRTDRSPGEIKRARREKIPIQKIDEEVYYNSDIYWRLGRPKLPAVSYEDANHIAIQVRKYSQTNYPQKGPTQNNIPTIHTHKESTSPSFLNIHGRFQLNRFYELYPILNNIVWAMQINEVEALKAIRNYLQAVYESIDNTDELKFIPNKREVIKQSFAAEREAIIVIVFTIVNGSFQKYKNYCSNLLKYALDNFLLVLSLLTQENNEQVEQLFNQTHREHLKRRGFEGIRGITELMTSLIVKIAKNDPLFAGEFCKIIEAYSSSSVKAQLYALLAFFSFYLHATKSEEKVPFLATSPAPYIIQPPLLSYTLVIDFSKIFLDSSVPLKKQIKKGHYSLRPYSQYFLGEMSKYFEVISFSEAMPIQSNKIIAKLDQKRCVKHKLYKYHIDLEQKRKDMQKVGRNLETLILLDTVEPMRPENVMLINPWKGQSSDAVLAQICPLLAMIAVKRLSAIDSLRKIREAMAKNASIGLKYINCGLDL